VSTLWGDGADDIWLAGAYRRALNWDGEHWSEVPGTLGDSEVSLPVFSDFHGRGSEVWAAEEYGPVWTGNRTRLTLLPGIPRDVIGSFSLSDVFALGTGEACAGADSGIFCFVGQSWQQETSGQVMALFDGVEGPQAIVTRPTPAILSRNAGTWTSIQSLTNGTVWPATSWDGTKRIFLPDPNDTSRIQLAGHPALSLPRPAQAIRQFWLGPDDEVVDYGSGVRLLAGDEWRTITPPEEEGSFRVSSVWGSRIDDLWATGQGGLARWDGAKWFLFQERPLGSVGALAVDVEGHWWAAGENGLLRESEDLGWQPVAGTADRSVTSLSAGNEHHVCFLDDQGKAYRWNGTSVERVRADDTDAFVSIACEPAGDVWLGGQGVLWHQTAGGDWLSVPLGTAEQSRVTRILPQPDGHPWLFVSGFGAEFQHRAIQIGDEEIRILPEAHPRDSDLLIIDGVPVVLSTWDTGFILWRWVEEHWEKIAERSARITGTSPPPARFWGDRLDDLWVVGPEAVSHWDGTEWNVSAVSNHFRAVMGDKQSIRVAGTADAILRRDR
jgi:hypothetical protein